MQESRFRHVPGRVQRRWLISLTAALFMACGAPPEAPEAELATGGGADCGSYPCLYTAQDVLDWQSSSVSPFDVANVPLAPRTLPDGPRVISTVDLGSRAFQAWFDRDPQGGSSGNVYNFTNWPYVASLNYYFHALLAVPPTVWVNAAHRNGVKVLGTMTSDCSGCGEQFNDLFAPANGLQPAQQLHAIAEAYGFDGWLIDIEAGATSSKNLLANLEALQRMKLSSGQTVEVLTYQAGVDAVNDQSYPLFQAAGEWESDYAYMSCGSPNQQPQPQQSYNYLNGKGEADRRFDSFWNLDVYRYSQGISCTMGADTIFNGNPPVAGASGNPCLNSACLFGGQGVGAIRASGTGAPLPPYYQSFAFFAAQWTAYGGTPDNGQPRPDTYADRQAFQAADDAYWLGYQAVPSGTACTLPSGLNAVSAFVPPSTPVLPVPFVTRFNEGEGGLFTLQGQTLLSSSWNQLSTQDVAPTWLCKINPASSVGAVVSYNLAYDGGSSLALGGSVVPGEDAEYALYQTRTVLPTNPGIAFSYLHTGGSGLSPYFRVTFDDGSTTRVIGQASGVGWLQAEAPLSGQGGKTVTRLSVGLTNVGSRAQTAELVFGELRLLDLDQVQTPALIQPQLDQGNLGWTAPSTPTPWYYNVFAQTGSSTCWQFLGRTTLTVYDLSQPLFAPAAAASAYAIQPVSTSGIAATLSAPVCTVS